MAGHLTHMTGPYYKDYVGIYGYGSLLKDAGAKIEPRIIHRMAMPSPWPIEYARRSGLWGGGPTLVIHPVGGAVHGQVLVLDAVGRELDYIRQCLREREGNPPDAGIREMKLAGLDHVLYCDLEPTLAPSEISPENLAGFAMASVRLRPDKNGVRYLRQNIEANIITPLTYAYQEEILRRSGANDLLEAEEVLQRGDAR